MNHRYKIRTFESRDGLRSLAAGTVILPMDPSFSLFATSIEGAEKNLCDEVRSGKLPPGRVYQICPLIGNPEAIRSIAIDEKANARRVVLDATVGMYSVLRSLRYSEAKATVEDMSFAANTVPA